MGKGSKRFRDSSKCTKPTGGLRFSQSSDALTPKQKRRAKRSKRDARLERHFPGSGPAASVEGSGPSASVENSCKEPKGIAGSEEAGASKRVKELYRQLDSLDCDGKPERCKLLSELVQLCCELRRSRQAVTAFSDLLTMDPDDSQYNRTRMLCLFVDQGMHMQAEELLQGPLFLPLFAEAATRTAAADVTSRAHRMAILAGHYSQTLLTYISVRLLHKDVEEPAVTSACEKSLSEHLWQAHACNPYVAEFIAFAPAFKSHFPLGSLTQFTASTDMSVSSAPLVEALEYCCVLGQVTVWLSIDDAIRKYIRATLFESAPKDGDWETPPLANLPVASAIEEPVFARWRLAREGAMEMWSEEMSIDGFSGDDGIGKGDSMSDRDISDSESSLGSSQAFADIEARILGTGC